MSKTVLVIRKGERRSTSIPFENIKEGDTFFANGYPIVASGDAHYSGDASYDGYIVDAGEEGWTEDEVDACPAA